HVAQHALQTLQDHRLIIDKKNPLFHAAFLSAEASGRRMINVVPRPTPVSKAMVPPCLSTSTECAIAKPCPVPLPTPLVVKNGSKIRPRMPSGIPPPESAMRISAQSPQRFVLTVIVPFPLRPSPTVSAMAWVALM